MMNMIKCETVSVLAESQNLIQPDGNASGKQEMIEFMRPERAG